MSAREDDIDLDNLPGIGEDEQARDMISLEEFLGEIGQGSGEPEEPEQQEEQAAEEDAEPEGEGEQEEDGGAEGESGEDVQDRLYAKKYRTVEELERGYEELSRAWDSRGQQRPAEQQQQQQPGQQEQPAPKPLFSGEIGPDDIKTEDDLIKAAQANPEQAAMWAMREHERLKPEQLDMVMNNWIAHQPWKAISTIQAWQHAVIREEIDERQALVDARYINQIRDEGVAEARRMEPTFGENEGELRDYIEQNPQLGQMIDACRTSEELTNALVGVYYMMIGPKATRELVELRTARDAAAAAQQERKEQEQAAASERTRRAATPMRSLAEPPGAAADDAKAVQDWILSHSRKSNPLDRIGK